MAALVGWTGLEPVTAVEQYQPRYRYDTPHGERTYALST